MTEQFSRDTGIPLDEIDIVYVVYEHVLQEARSRIYEATGYDFFNDSPSKIYTYGSLMATCYDYTEEAKQRRIADLAKLDREEREELLEIDIFRFFAYIGITQADNESEAEGQRKADNVSEYIEF